ncbi:MAG TPA: HAD family phosphatase [Allosphingosinicella sp.]|nr:HAD family phosphatase [Allosphingosinicella sp.]
MRFEALIFDFDGVIVDSEILSNAILADALTALGHPTSLEQAVERYIGLNWRDMGAVIEAEIGRPLPAGFRARAKEAFELRLDEVTAVAGVEAFLAAIPSIPKAVASSSPTQWLRDSLERFGLSRHFENRLFSAAEHVDRGKPHPDIYLHAARALGVRPAAVLVLEDTPTGVKSARAAGMTVVGLCAGLHCGAGHGERLRAAGADHIAGSYAEVSSLVMPDLALPFRGGVGVGNVGENVRRRQ